MYTRSSCAFTGSTAPPFSSRYVSPRRFASHTAHPSTYRRSPGTTTSPTRRPGFPPCHSPLTASPRALGTLRQPNPPTPSQRPAEPHAHAPTNTPPARTAPAHPTNAAAPHRRGSPPPSGTPSRTPAEPAHPSPRPHPTTTCHPPAACCAPPPGHPPPFPPPACRTRTDHRRSTPAPEPSHGTSRTRHAPPPRRRPFAATCRASRPE